MPPARLDTLRTVETPEGVSLALRVAGPVVRAQAYLLDQGIRFGLYSFLAAPLAMLGDAGIGVILVMVFVLEWFYPVLFEVLWRGQTPGKAAFRLAVVHDDGRPLSWGSSLLRNLLRFADFLPFAWLGGLASMLMSEDFKRLGDHAAGTVVIYQDPPRARLALPDAAPLPLPAPLTVEEQRAILDYAARSATWSPDRCAELAAVLEPLARTPREVQGMAAWLVGRR